MTFTVLLSFLRSSESVTFHSRPILLIHSVLQQLLMEFILLCIFTFQYAPGGELFDYIVAKDKLKVETFYIVILI